MSANIENNNLLLLNSDNLKTYIDKQISKENFCNKSTLIIFLSFLCSFFNREFIDYWISICLLLLIVFCCMKKIDINMIYKICNQNAIELDRYTKEEVNSMIKEHIENDKEFSEFEMKKINKYYDIQDEKIIEKNIDNK